MKIARLLTLAIIVLIPLNFAAAQTQLQPASVTESKPALSPLEQKLVDARYELHIGDGKFSGTAAPVLEKAISGAQYVLIGEAHLTQEVPRFSMVVCDVMARDSLTAMAVEAGPQAAQFVSNTFGKKDRLEQMAALTRRYPDSVAFLNVRQENDLAAHCAEASHNSSFQLWGLDQEFLGSAGWLLDQILTTHPGPTATASIERLKTEEKLDEGVAKEKGDAGKLFLMGVSDSQLAETAALLNREGNAMANTLFRELTESHEIYLKNSQGSPDSNSQRARLLKQNFHLNLEKASGKRPQRILVKFGGWHLYKGFNPIHQRDLGNYIAELADAQGAVSLHIYVFGAKGVQFEYGGYRRPAKLAKFSVADDDSVSWIKPVLNEQIANAWTVYDLRKLRFARLGTLDPEMDRLIYGYDLLVVAPEITPADPIE